jgi:threonine dehydrogenase-like Zn-dependent dehydrogenase
MRALVYTGPNSVAFRAEPDPTPGNDEVLVRVEAVGICGSDMHAYHGHDSRRPAPLILGHEAAGRIATGQRTGERVTINPLVVDPACPYAIEGRPHLSPTRQLLSMPPRPGAFAELVRVPEQNLVAIPDDFDIAKAALAEPIAVSWHAVRLGAAKLHGEIAAARVVVLGAGAIGVTAALVAKLFGAAEIFIGEPNALRRRSAERVLGVPTYAPDGPDAPADNSTDLVIDAVGAAGTRAAASRMVRPGGVIVHLGLLPGLDGLDVRKVTLQEVTFTGSYCYTPTDFRNTVDAMVAGRLGPLDWADQRPLSEGARAFADIDAGLAEAPKIVLRP